MSAPQPLIPLEEEQDRNTQKVNGKRFAIPHQDIINEMQVKQPEVKSSETLKYAELLAKARVRPTDIIDEDPACLTIEKEGKVSVVGTMGNISTVAGRAKAKKTFAVSFAIAAAVASTLILNRIKGALPVDKSTVLFFDTEQSKHHVLKVIKRICRLCNVPNPPNLLVYSLRPYAPDDRLKAIDFAINNTPNLGLVVIDGVRDLAVDPVLDSEQASHIITHLLQWTDRLNIHIMCVLHQNKNDTNLRGHLGTEMVNKSETVISVTRDNRNREVSHVEADYCRNQEFDPFSFSVDDSGIPYLVDDNIEASERTPGLRGGNQKKRKADPVTAESMTPTAVSTIINRAFSQEEHLSYSQLRTAVIEASEFVGSSLSKNRAEVFIKRTIDQRQVIKFRPEKSRYDAYRLPIEDTVDQPS